MRDIRPVPPASFAAPPDLVVGDALDALPAHIALLDDAGTILAVNRAWRRFADDHGLAAADAGVGTNYLAASEPAAPVIAAGLRSVMSGEHERFTTEYPCAAPGALGWYRLTATRIGSDGRVRVLVAHEDVSARRLAEADRGEYASRYHAALEASLDAVYLLRTLRDASGEVTDFEFTDVNRRGLEFIGLPRQAVLGARLCELLPLNRTGGFVDRYIRVVETGEPLEEEFRLDGPERPARWLHHQVVRVGDGVAITTRDVTARREIEDALRESEERYRSVVGALTEGVMVVDASGVIVAWNPSAKRILGLTSDEISGRTVMDPRWGTVRDDGSPFLVEDYPVTVTLRTGEPRSGVVMGVHAPDQSLRWIEINTQPLRRPNEALPYAAVASFVDVTDRRRDEDALRFQAHLLSAMQQAVISTDADHLVTSWNRHAEEIYGYTSAEALGRPLFDLIGLAEEGDFDPAAVAAREGGSQGQLRERRVRRKDGSLLWVSANVSPLHDAQGRLTGFVGLTTDITARRELEDRLRQAQRMEAVGRLAGGVAHDFNNLLTVIRSFADFALRAVPADAPVRADVEEIRTAAVRATELTRQLLAFSRKQTLQPRVVDVNRSVTAVRAMLARVIGEHIALETVLDPAPCPVLADPGQLDQVLMNLAVNARDAMPDGGVLVIRTANVEVGTAAAVRAELVPGPWVTLSVEDTGVGIPRDVLPHIFDPFFTTKGVGRGTGLGLATVYGIVRQSGGVIEANSASGAGTRFTIYLPRHEGEAAGSATIPLPEPDLPRGTETILLVEDQSAVRQVVRRALEEHGYTVLDAMDGAAGLALWRAHAARVDLLLTDAVMPVMGGRALATTLWADRPDLPVILMTGYEDAAAAEQLPATRAAHRMEKPVTPELVLRRVRDVLDQRS